ncbi:MAG: hypothetical protein PHQ50_06565 [Eubacteriales bacterium]|nr:hypothetical protein [Eubacteriales bacterium]
MKNHKKIISKILILSMVVAVAMTGTASVYAGEPNAGFDESMYVSLDSYGAIKEASVVKACNLNGQLEIKDYGNYEEVTNMSGYDKPLLDTDGVRFQFKDQDPLSRFYFNCKLKKEKIELPWSFDVSYKLNGVPATAERIAGADGLVEITIDVKTNAKAAEYFKNNMLLQVALLVNMEEVYSLDAPGSQLQSMGTYKAVVFAALPGEETQFTIRIGSDAFESEGITMMMIPGTLEQLQNIKELKEAKDKLKNSGDAVYFAMNDILSTMESMENGISSLNNGTKGMEEARATFNAGKGQMQSLGDQTLKDLTAVNAQLKEMIPYFETAQKMNDELISDISGMLSSLEDLEDPLKDTKSSVVSMNAQLTSMQTMLKALNTQIETNLTAMKTLAAGGGLTPYELTALQGDAAVAKIIGNYEGNIDSLLKGSVALGKSTVDIINITNELIDESDDLNGTLHDYKDDVDAVIEDSGQLTTVLSSSLDSSLLFLTYSKTLLRESGNKLDSAAELSLSGMSELLEKSLLGLKSVDSLRTANDTIKTTVDDELASIEEENRFLNLDPEAPLVSFTSDKNPEPESIQIILRTEEISIDQFSDDLTDLDPEKEDIGLLARIAALFKRMIAVLI